MTTAIQETCLACGTCAQYLAKRPAEPMRSHEIPSRPWSKVSTDLFKLNGRHYLVMVDHYSDFFELDSLRSTVASTVIRAMKRNFARHSIQDECISDNGPQFDSHEHSHFAKEYGFTLIKSSPYHSQGNKKAESAVKVAKNILKKSHHEDPYLALLAYRNTPQQGYAYSPAQRLMSRRLQDIIPRAPSQLRPRPPLSTLVVQDIGNRRKRFKMYYDKKVSTQLREFSRRDKVFVKPSPHNKHKAWVYGEVIGNYSAPRACLVSSPLGPIRRNHRPVRSALTKSSDSYTERPNDFDNAYLPETDSRTAEQTKHPVSPTSPEPTPTETVRSDVTLCRSSRNQKMPSRLKD